MSKSDNKIIAVVVTYNRKELLRTTIKCILNQNGKSSDILIVDNNSSDGTKEMIIQEYNQKDVIYCNTGKNLGGAGGFEFGVRKAVELGYEYVWIMDDDTWPNPQALEQFFVADEELGGNWGFLSSVAYWTDGSICRMNIQKKNIFKHVGKNAYEEKIVPIKMCSFVSLLVKSSVIREVGLPIGDYFIWTDDYEFTGRISKIYPCYMIPSSTVVHAMKTHIRVNFAKDSADRIDRYQYIYRNDVHCYRQYGISGWIYILSKDIYTIVDIILHSEKNKRKKIGVILKGLKVGIKYFPTIKFIKDV